MRSRAPRLCALGAGLCFGWLGSSASGQSASPAGASPEPSSTAPAQDVEPRLDWDKPILCLSDDRGTRLYAQCDLDRKTCLFHDGCITGTSGKRCIPLDRLKGCTDFGSGGQIYQELRRDGVRFVRAGAETPPGWQRDSEGEIFQTHFDMNRRLWLGAHWLPSYGSPERYELGSAGFDTGLRVEWLSDDTRMRHRLHVLNGELWLNPLGARATLLRYDGSTESDTPLVRITTFWPPERHDLYASVGWFGEIVGVELRPRGSRDETLLRIAAAGPTWDLWHSTNLGSFLRLRFGAAFDDLMITQEPVTHRWTLTPLAALEADVLVDEQGLHRLSGATGFELPLVWDRVAPEPAPAYRFLNEIAYELVVVAIDDQPLSLRFAAGGGFRNDLLEPVSGWELTGSAGLRFSFWAPAPDADDARRIAEVRGP